MDLRLALYELAARHRLDATGSHKLAQLAGLNREPAQLAYWLPRGVAVLAAALGGFGVILWVAANWETLGRYGRFGLLQALFLVMCGGALVKPSARAPLGLMALLTIGGLFAYFGQTYQTGADPWQLFAVWAVLALPLCFSVRSDVLWTPWALIVSTGISLWVHAHTAHDWRVEPQDLHIYAVAWSAALGLTLALSPVFKRWSGSGLWAMRTAVTLATLMVSTTSLGALFSNKMVLLYGLGLGLLAGTAFALASRKLFDIFCLSAVGLGLNVLLIFGLGKVLFHDTRGDFWMGAMLLLGLAAAGLLAGTVGVLLRLSRRDAAQGGGV
ncbi:DUF2157 domain-containing protein [Rhodoferax sp. AJA081-3]|uniref:DUF2157 domain-containing protein n=1 Tax=Rhodoferax sp. AJA081-3 TaxID=2752316 RepID=UPI001AE0CF1F|nr:DUF2157 domain-containing protein [Rhodoferax sp. AJA081-3]QTN26921.1 DUF2157 domain-containing protein [Rhodoferax sp. AJA081-3]